MARKRGTFKEIINVMAPAYNFSREKNNMFRKEIKLMKEDHNYYLLTRWGKQCAYCPENKCVLCVEEKKFLNETLNKENNNGM